MKAEKRERERRSSRRRRRRKFHENEKKERIFPIPSSTSRTLIRRSGFTLTRGYPLASPLYVSLSFSLPPPLSLSQASRRSLFPRLSFFIFLPPSCCSSSIPTVFEEELVASRASRIPLGTTGSAVAMPLPAERNRYMGQTEKLKEESNTRRERERERRDRGRVERGILQREAIAAKSFSSRGEHTYVGVSFPRLIQHTELI